MRNGKRGKRRESGRIGGGRKVGGKRREGGTPSRESFQGHALPPYPRLTDAQVRMGGRKGGRRRRSGRGAAALDLGEPDGTVSQERSGCGRAGEAGAK